VSTEFPGHRPDDPDEVPGQGYGDLPGNLADDPLGSMRGDLLDDIVSSEPGLDTLVGLLTSEATHEELTSEQTALAMFRAHRPPVIPLPELGADAPGAPGVAEYRPPAFGRSEYGPPAVDWSQYGPPAVERFEYGPPGAEAPGAEAPGAEAPGAEAPAAWTDTRETGTPGFGVRDPWVPVPSAPGSGAPVAPVLPGPGAPGSRPPGRGRRVGLMAAAVTLAAAAGFAVAAYTETLPAPLQQAAYHAFGFAGVPSTHHSAPGAAASQSPGPGRRHGSHQPGQPQQPGASASAQPSASGPAPSAGQLSLSITSSSGRIMAGEDDTFTGNLTSHSGPVAGVSLTLQERVAGQPGWVLAGSASTGSDGSAAIFATDLTRNAAFRLRGSDGALSRPVVVIVAPPVTASVGAHSGAKTATVGASSPLATPRDTVVLQIRSGATWMSVQMARLNGADQASFLVRVRPKLRIYRVVLLPTALHGISVSNAVTVPSR
jgi:hypothetical protein